jgi:hypothetical protein
MVHLIKKIKVMKKSNINCKVFFEKRIFKVGIKVKGDKYLGMNRVH